MSALPPHQWPSHPLAKPARAPEEQYDRAANRRAWDLTGEQIAEAEAFKIASAGCLAPVQRAGGPGCCDGFALRAGTHRAPKGPPPARTIAERKAQIDNDREPERQRAGKE